MIAFTLNLLLALVWVVLTGTSTAANFVFGFLLGYFILRFTQHRNKRFTGYFGKPWKVTAFILIVFWDLIKSNVRVAYDVLTPYYNMRPAVIAIDLEATTDAEITMLANTITLTPGSLSIDVSTDRKTLYLHTMYLDDEEAMRAEIKALERRIIDLLK